MVGAAVVAALLGFAASATANHNSFSHVSAGARKGNGPYDVLFKAATTDGVRVFFETDEQLANEDTDGRKDVYERSGGVTALVSKGSVNGNGEFSAEFAGMSQDGFRVFFTTAEKLTGDDADTARRRNDHAHLEGPDERKRRVRRVLRRLLRGRPGGLLQHRRAVDGR